MSVGVASVLPGRMFRVGAADGTFDPMGDLDMDDVSGQGAVVEIFATDVDSEKLFYVQSQDGGTNIALVGCNPDDGSLTDPLGLSRFFHKVWAVLDIAPGATPAAVEADGAYAYVAWDTTTPTGGLMTRHNRDTGVINASNISLTSPAPENFIAANGIHVAVPSNTDVTVMENISDSLWNQVADATGIHGARIRTVAIDHEYVYIGGDRGTGNFDVRALQLPAPGGSAFPMTLIWSWSATPTPLTVRGIAADGERVYVVTDATVVGGVFNLFVLSRETNGTDGPQLCYQTLINAPGSTGGNARGVDVDDQYIYVRVTSNALAIVDKAGGCLLTYVQLGTSSVPPKATVDGRRVYWHDNGGDSLFSAWRGTAMRNFQRVKGDDNHRKPFNNLASPDIKGF
jgi:hypothetical protein